MRILHVDSARGWRGGQNQVLLTAAGMARRGHHVSVACQAAGPLEGRCRDAGLEIHPLRFHGDFSLAATLSLASVLRRERPALLQLHDPHALAAGLLAQRLGPRTATIATRRVDFRLHGRLSRAKYRAADRVVVVSGAIAQVLEGDGVSPQRLRLVHEGVTDRPPLPGGAELLAGLGVPAGAAVIGNVAALVDHKDHATLVEAAARVVRERPETYFVVAGEGERRGDIEARVQALGLGRRFILAGFRHDLDRLIPAFTLFCLSSRLEGLGTSLLDAMCFSRAVVATAAGGIPDAVEDGSTGRLAPTGDPSALARALLDVLADPERREAMGRAGRCRFEERFSADRMVERTLEVYAEVAP
jgi:glycosyltransferase involved in cell wall biosynthesis